MWPTFRRLPTTWPGSFSSPLGGILALKSAFSHRAPSAPHFGLPANRKAPAVVQAQANRSAAAALFGLGALSAASGTAVAAPDGVKRRQNTVAQGFDRLPENNTSRAAAKSTTSPLFESLDDAVAARDTLLLWIDGLGGSVPDNIFLLLQDLRFAVAKAVPDADNELPRLRLFTPSASLPVVVLAYQIHGDAERSGEMLRQNTVPHPGFMPVRPLRVLAD